MVLAELEKPLSASAIRQREQNGVKLSYIEGHHAIREANRIFGFAGWDRKTTDPVMVQCEQVDGKWRVSYTARCTITIVVEGTERQGVGFGQGIDRDLGRAHESAIKEAETDAMKRALMTFGDPFGLALYDKEQTHVEGKAKKDPKEPQKAPVRKGKADPTAPFGWLMSDILPGEWQMSTVSDKQYKYYQELLAQHGISTDLSPGFRSMIVRTYGLDAEIINKAGGYSFAIEFLKDAPDDSILAAVEATNQALAQRKPADHLADRVNEVYAGATANGK